MASDREKIDEWLRNNKPSTSVDYGEDQPAVDAIKVSRPYIVINRVTKRSDPGPKFYKVNELTVDRKKLWATADMYRKEAGLPPLPRTGEPK